MHGSVPKLCPTLEIPWTVARQAPLSIGILQARIPEWVAISFSRGSTQFRNWTLVSCIAGRFFTDWAIREAPFLGKEGSYDFYTVHTDEWCVSASDSEASLKAAPCPISALGNRSIDKADIFWWPLLSEEADLQEYLKIETKQKEIREMDVCSCYYFTLPEDGVISIFLYAFPINRYCRENLFVGSFCSVWL